MSNRLLPRRILTAVATAAMMPLMSMIFAGAAHADIPIAVVGPITGQYAQMGEQMRRGAEMAVANINKAGGIKGEAIKLVVEDDACDPKQAVAVANKLASAGVKYVVGHFCSGSSIPASDVYHEEEMVQITPGSTNASLTEKKYPKLFRTCYRDDQSAKFVANIIAGEMAGKKLAILNDRSAYGKGFADEVRGALAAKGITPVLDDAITAGEKDYAAIISKMKQVGVNLLAFGGYHSEAGLILRQAADQGLKLQLIAGDSLIVSDFWSIAGDRGDGARFVWGVDPRNLASAKTVVDQMRAQKFEPEGYTINTYVAVEILAQAMAAVDKPNPTKVAAAMHQQSFQTLKGAISFDAKGDIKEPDLALYIWRKGKFQEVKP
ncbi:MAG: branched-chain amino acid ABC transporter substrate-binding protein [Alphaproteobacteria bacterium]|nr:branched-chain amino acid ABC transporter substrate-binding protein [Alphaproteobacteria bacterium]